MKDKREMKYKVNKKTKEDKQKVKRKENKK